MTPARSSEPFRFGGTCRASDAGEATAISTATSRDGSSSLRPILSEPELLPRSTRAPAMNEERAVVGRLGVEQVRSARTLPECTRRAPRRRRTTVTDDLHGSMGLSCQDDAEDSRGAGEAPL